MSSGILAKDLITEMQRCYDQQIKIFCGCAVIGDADTRYIAAVQLGVGRNGNPTYVQS